MKAMPGNPCDGHTLRKQIEQVERITGGKVKRAYVDCGYRGHGLAGPEIHISHTSAPRSPTIKRELKRRNAIEPVIGHTKSDGLLERNHLAGADGDAINAILAAAGHNVRLLLRWLRDFLLFVRICLLMAKASEPNLKPA
jgi:IS5 family transposase